MTILGTIIVIVVAIILTIFIGPYGFLVLISIPLGLIVSTHIRTKEIHSDLQIIKEKLGIQEKDDFNMTTQEIEEELEKELDRQLEFELEERVETKDLDKK